MTPLSWLILAAVAIYVTVGVAVFEPGYLRSDRVRWAWLWLPIIVWDAITDAATWCYRRLAKHGRWEAILPQRVAGDRHITTIRVRVIAWRADRKIRRLGLGWPDVVLRDRRGRRPDVTFPGFPAKPVQMRDVSKDSQ